MSFLIVTFRFMTSVEIMIHESTIRKKPSTYIYT